MNISSYRTIAKLVLVVLITPFYVYAADGLYSAVTEDGVVLKMKRYRPDANTPFRTYGRAAGSSR